jgi:hypothetical protein
MKGKILDYSIQNSGGVISGEDGNRYEFLVAEWKSDKAPKINQKVDFEIDGKIAKGIYLESVGLQLDTDELKSKFSDIKNSDTISKISSQGAQNKYGFILSLITAFALFLPIMKIPLLGKVILINDSIGKVLFVLLLLSAFLFYTGVKQGYVKIVVSTIVIVTMYEFFDLLLAVNSTDDMINELSMFGGSRYNSSINPFALLQIGAGVLILLMLLLAKAGFSKRYKQSI